MGSSSCDESAVDGIASVLDRPVLESISQHSDMFGRFGEILSNLGGGAIFGSQGALDMD